MYIIYIYIYYVIFRPSLMIKPKQQQTRPPQTHETIVERLRSQFYLGRQIVFLVDLVEY